MKKLYKTLLVIIWLIIIFLFSEQNGVSSTALTNNILEKYLWFINSDIFFIIIRKLAHFTEYFILGILVLNMLKEYSIKKEILCSILLCIVCACFDEIHQLFISGRSGKILDVFIDTSGAIFSIYLISKIVKRKN